MKNELKIFENEAFGKVRIIEKNNEPWFVGKDVADILGYKNGSRDINVHVDEEDRLKYQIRTAGQAREQTLINESGLYSLILYSKLPAAKKFKRWVTSEILPSIRKTGSYSVNQDIKAREVEARLNNSRARVASTFLKVAQMTDLLEYKHICQQKAAEVLSGLPLLPMEEAKEITYSATDIGKMLGVSANKIGKIANQHNLKTPQYGKLFYSKSEHSCKEVETFRYYECAILKFREILKGGVVA